MTPPLTKADYLAALQCPRRLWQAVRAPERASPPEGIGLALAEEGREIGRFAHALFPGGVLVQGAFESAARATRERLPDAQVPALFEAAFEHEGVRVRCDVLERLDRGFGLREVKAGTRLRQAWLDDLVIQLRVLRGCGIDVRSVELVHVDESYVRHGSLDPGAFFVRRDVREDVEFLLDDAAKQVAAMRDVLAGDEPEVEPSPHCRRPTPCPFSASCRGARPADWIGSLPGLRSAGFHDLRARGIERVGEVPHDFPLDARQRRAVEAHRASNGIAVAESLPRLLRGSGPPSAYLDFETFAPGLPLYPGTRPYQPIPAQWSLHRIDAAGDLGHVEFLADASGDPRRAFAQSLVDALEAGDEPILVYSAFESAVLSDLGDGLPDLAPALERIRARLFDLLPVVRSGVYATDFGGSFSLKRVGAALVPGFGYSDLEDVADGGAAALALTRLMRGDADDPERLRAALLRYCARDTQALVEVHAALRALAG